MADFSYIDVEKLVVAWEEEEYLWNISGGGGRGGLKSFYNYLDLPFSRGGSRGSAPAPAPPPKIGKNMIFLHKIVIFHTKYPKKNSRDFFKYASPNLTSWIRSCSQLL